MVDTDIQRTTFYELVVASFVCSLLLCSLLPFVIYRCMRENCGNIGKWKMKFPIKYQTNFLSPIFMFFNQNQNSTLCLLLQKKTQGPKAKAEKFCSQKWFVSFVRNANINYLWGWQKAWFNENGKLLLIVIEFLVCNLNRGLASFSLFCFFSQLKVVDFHENSMWSRCLFIGILSNVHSFGKSFHYSDTSKIRILTYSM